MRMHLVALLARLDWREVLRYAIESRPTSWSEKPVVEWRNAGDTIFCGVMNALREFGVDPYEAVVEWNSERHDNEFLLEVDE